ncbi:MAG: hypothetical protein VW338_00200 [Rhodospirillaceae bacterium]
MLSALLPLAMCDTPALAQNAVSPLNVARTTPDLAVTASASAAYAIPGGTVRWIYLKNDCAKPLWFDLEGRDLYPLKLLQNQAFEGYFRVNSIKVSPDNTGTACTFTAVGGR